MSEFSRIAGPSNYQTKAPLQIEYCNNIADWAVAGTNASKSTGTNVKFGTSALRITCVSNGAGNFAQLLKTLGSPINTSKDGKLCVWVYVPDYSTIDTSNGIQIALMDAGLTKTLYAHYIPQYSGWHCINIYDTMAGTYSGGMIYGATGGATVSDLFSTMRVRVYPKNSNTAVVDVDSWHFGPRNRPKLLITVDDGDDDFWTNIGGVVPYDYLNNAGLKHTSYIIGSLIGTAGYLTEANLLSMYNAGHDLATHGELNLTSLANDAARRADVASNKNWLLARGFARAADHYAYPNGAYEMYAGDDSIFQIMRDMGMKTARAVDRRTLNDCSTGVANHLCYQALGHSHPAETGGLLLTRLDDLAKVGGVMFNCFHQWSNGTPSSSVQCAIADWTAYIDKAALMQKRGQIDVVTISQYHDGLSIPRVSP